jgi:hypothetical protein
MIPGMRRRKGEWDIVFLVFATGLFVCMVIFIYMPPDWIAPLFYPEINEPIDIPKPAHVHRYPF